MLLTAGCSSGSEPVATDNKSYQVDPDHQSTAMSKVGTGTKINGATTVGSPTETIPEGGVVFRPADPSDPRFNADPKLGGGN